MVRVALAFALLLSVADAYSLRGPLRRLGPLAARSTSGPRAPRGADPPRVAGHPLPSIHVSTPDAPTRRAVGAVAAGLVASAAAAKLWSAATLGGGLSAVLDVQLLGASVGAMGKLVACVLIGMLAARKGGPLDAQAVNVLSKLVYGVFQPALLLTSVAATTAGGGGATLAVLPAFAMLQILIGAALGKGVVRLFNWRKGSAEARSLVLLSTFANSGPLPLLLVDALFRAGSPEVLNAAVGYVAFYLLGWSPAFWTVGSAIVQPPRPAAAAARGRKAPAGNPFAAVLAWVRSPWGRRILSPPVLACYAGLLLGSVAPLRDLFVAAGAPLRPLMDGAKTFGGGYLPAVVLVLAGAFARRAGEPASLPAGGAAPAGPWEAVAAGEKRRRQRMLLLGVLALRFAVMPMVGVGLVTAFERVGLLAEQDVVLKFVLLLESCMPSAQNSVVIMQMQGDDSATTRMAKLLAKLYLVGIVPLTLLVGGAFKYVGL